MPTMNKLPRHYERYELAHSPLAQNPTQKQFAELLGVKKSRLEALIRFKEHYTVRREELIKGKLRKLIYPRGQFRSIHEKLKFHLNKVKQPSYIYSPRKGRGQRDNASLHLGQTQFLKIDIKQFYPSTSAEHVFRWAKYELGMREDVAGLLVHLSTIDGTASFGSPLTPVLATLIHRSMFDAIYKICTHRGLRMSLWVDDMTISGRFVPGEVVDRIREVIKTYGLRSHKLTYSTSSRFVRVTGIMVKRYKIDAPKKLHLEIRDLYGALARSDSATSYESVANRLLGQLGNYRRIVGGKTIAGRKAADRMNNLRQRKAKAMQTIIDLSAAIGAMDASADFGDEPAPF